MEQGQFQDRFKTQLNKYFERLSPQILKSALQGYALARSTSFALQGALLPWVDYAATGKKRASPKNYQEHLKEALPKIQKLFDQDIENIVNGLYPLQVLKPENLVSHATRIPRVAKDAFLAAQRRESKNHEHFDETAQTHFDEVPEYYKRNFHFQTSGYLGKESAELYEHQVEVLFSGAADAMRRLALAPIKTHLASLNLPQDGAGLNFLEIGSGTGKLTEFLALTFPKARITALDLSSVYLQKAKANLQNYPRINFVQGAGENLPFQEQSFDVVVSCFLFHELPREIREQVLKESSRVLKPAGFVVGIDSIQENDDQDFEWALEQFPQDFHEPFYKNYTQNPLETLWENTGLKNVQSEIGFLSKVVTGVKV